MPAAHANDSLAPALLACSGGRAHGAAVSCHAGGAALAAHHPNQHLRRQLDVQYEVCSATGQQAARRGMQTALGGGRVAAERPAASSHADAPPVPRPLVRRQASPANHACCGTLQHSSRGSVSRQSSSTNSDLCPAPTPTAAYPTCWRSTPTPASCAATPTSRCPATQTTRSTDSTTTEAAWPLGRCVQRRVTCRSAG